MATASASPPKERQAGKKLWIRKKDARGDSEKQRERQTWSWPFVFYCVCASVRRQHTSRMIRTRCAQVKLIGKTEEVVQVEGGTHTYTHLIVIWCYDFYVFSSSNNGLRDIIYSSYMHVCLLQLLHSSDIKEHRTLYHFNGIDSRNSHQWRCRCTDVSAQPVICVTTFHPTATSIVCQYTLYTVVGL